MDTLVAFGHFGDLHHPKVSKMLTTKVSKALNIFLIQESRVTSHHIQLVAFPVTLSISNATVLQLNFEKLFLDTLVIFGHFGDLHHPKVSKMLTTKVSKVLNIFLIQESRVTSHHIQLVAFPVTLPISPATVVQLNFKKLFLDTLGYNTRGSNVIRHGHVQPPGSSMRLGRR